MKFKHLNVPESWEHYWSRYPEGYTILEALISWVSQVDDMVDNVNNWNMYLDGFVLQFDERLQTEVTQILTDWQNSGFLEVVISEALQWQLTDYIATNEADKNSFTTQLQQIENNINLTPDDFEGTDIEKITQAYVYASENDIPSITLNRTYDLTGGTVYIPSVDWARKVQFFGGKLIKNDSGFMFSRISENQSINAPTFLNVVFEGAPGTEAVIYNGDVMIRTQAFNCEFSYIAFLHTTFYTQSLIIANSLMQLATSSFIKSDWNLDMVLTNNRFETSHNHLLEAVLHNPNSFAITSGRFVDNVIEGYTTKAPLKISSAVGFKYSGNYNEKNILDLEFVTSSGLKIISGEITTNNFWSTLGNLNISFSSDLNLSRLRMEDNTSNMQSNSQKAMASRITGYFDNNYMTGGGKLFLTDAPYFTVKELLDEKSNRSWETINPITLQNGWSGTLNVSKNNSGLVSIDFDLVSGVTASNTLIGTLPVAYRPLQSCGISLRGPDGVLSESVFIHKDGRIMCSAPNNLTSGSNYTGVFLFKHS